MRVTVFGGSHTCRGILRLRRGHGARQVAGGHRLHRADRRLYRHHGGGFARRGRTGRTRRWSNLRRGGTFIQSIGQPLGAGGMEEGDAARAPRGADTQLRCGHGVAGWSRDPHRDRADLEPDDRRGPQPATLDPDRNGLAVRLGRVPREPWRVHPGPSARTCALRGGPCGGRSDCWEALH